MAQQTYFQISNSKEKKCLTVDTRDVNDLGPGKFRTSAESNFEQTCYFNRNNSDSRFTSYLAKRVNQENLVFSIFKINFDQNFGYKNLELNPQNLFFNGNINEKCQSTYRENFRDGKSSRSETSENDRKSNQSLQSEPTSARLRVGGGGGGGGGLSRTRDRGCSEQFRGSARKRPRFLSDRKIYCQKTKSQIFGYQNKIFSH